MTQNNDMIHLRISSTVSLCSRYSLIVEDVCGDGALSSRLRDKLRIDADSISLWTRLLGCRL